MADTGTGNRSCPDRRGESQRYGAVFHGPEGQSKAGGNDRRIPERRRIHESRHKHHGGLYTGLLLSGKLNTHLEEIDHSANEMLNLLMKQYAERERVTEDLNAQDQMEWIGRMGSIRERAEETVFSELIYL